MTGTVVIARAFTSFEARLIVATLASHGVAANALWAETMSNAWHHMLALGGIRIEIGEADADAATAILSDIETALPPRPRVPFILLLLMALPMLGVGATLPLRLRAELPRMEHVDQLRANRTKSAV